MKEGETTGQKPEKYWRNSGKQINMGDVDKGGRIG